MVVAMAEVVADGTELMIVDTEPVQNLKWNRKCGFYFGVTGQHCTLEGAEAFRCLALGETEVVDTVFRHQARSLHRQRAAESIATGAGVTGQNSGSSGACASSCPGVDWAPGVPAAVGGK